MSAKRLSIESLSGPQTPEPVVVGGGAGLSTSVIPEGSLDPIYEAKARVLNSAMLEIGFGKYHKALFVVAGFGWLADNVRAVL